MPLAHLLDVDADLLGEVRLMKLMRVASIALAACL